MFKEEKYGKKILKKYFIKKIIMAEEDEANFKASIECDVILTHSFYHLILLH